MQRQSTDHVYGKQYFECSLKGICSCINPTEFLKEAAVQRCSVKKLFLEIS